MVGNQRTVLCVLAEWPYITDCGSKAAHERACKTTMLNQSRNPRPRRFILCGLLLVLVSTTTYFTFSGRSSPSPSPASIDLDHLDEPPTYEKLIEWESNLPQHNLDLPFPEGRTGRYVLFKNQIEGLGWNNELNEV